MIPGPTPAGRSIKLLQIGKYFHPDQGGVETVTLAISDALAPLGIQADVLCFSRRPSYPPYDASFRVIRARTDFRISNKSISIDYFRKIGQLAPEYDIGLLHLPNPIGLLGAVRSWNKPLIAYWHTDIESYPLVGKFFRRYEKRLIDQSSRMLVPTMAHVTGSYLADELTPKACVIRYPFDRTRLPAPDPEAPAVVRARQFAAGRRIVAAVGRLVPYKGFDVLVAAARSLRQDLCVVIAGAGPLQTFLEKEIARHQVGDKVLLLGSINDTELAGLYKESHLVTMPSVSRAEMYGITQVEAMSFGIPVVSTDIPWSGVNHVNVDGETGLIVPVGNAAALAEALNRLAADGELYARLSAGALQSVRDTHDMSQAGQKIADVVRSVVTQGAPPSQPDSRAC